MDERSFDRFARLLGEASDRRAGLKAALAAVLGGPAAVSALEAGAEAKRKEADRDRGNGRPGGTGRVDPSGLDAGRRKRRKTCKPACGSGFDCVKVGRKRQCVCSTGVECGGACCALGQSCQDGACSGQPDPDTCIPAGEPCKGVGRTCCGGRTCASGQGGRDDVACYVHKTGACQSTADCVFGTACIDGRCGFDVPPPAAIGASCNPDVGQQCADPAATCTRYDGPDAPGGAYCTLPLGVTCTGDPECTCYKCWYPDGTFAPAARLPKALDPSSRLACCGPEGYACTSDRNCCLGTVCVNGTCQTGTCDVCASGCAYATIQEAVYDVARFPAGSTIRIAPGSYVNDVGVLFPWNAGAPPIADATMPTGYDRNLSFQRCGAEGQVHIAVSKRILNMSGSSPTPITRMAFAGLDFIGQNGDPTYLATLMVAEAPDGNSRIRIELTDCRVSDFLNGYETALMMKQFTDLVLAGCTLSNNRGDQRYGAVRVQGDATLLASDCLFSDNAAEYGAAVRLENGAVGELRNCVLRGNTATKDGGAVLTQNDARAVVIDSLIEGNSAGQDNATGGGGICVDKGSLALQGSTRIVGNTAVGSSGLNGGGVLFKGTGAVSGITAANAVTIADNVSTQCVLLGNQAPNGVRWPVVTDCRNWCAPDNYIIAQTNTSVTTAPAACATECCSRACSYYDSGSRRWFCTSGS